MTFLTDVPIPWDIFFAVSPFSVLAYVTLSIFFVVSTLACSAEMAYFLG